MTDLFRVAVPRDFVGVSGTDATTFLQGQLSQDIDVVRSRGSAWSFLLQPQGKVDAWLRVSVAGSEAFVLDVDAGFGEAVVTRLNRFRLRVAVDISVLAWQCVAVRGDRASHVSGLDAEWPGIEGVDVVGPSVDHPVEVDAGRVGSIEEYEQARILAGVPAMGREITTATIPAETGVLGRSASFTKGCYTGQELVARIDSRGGNVPRHVRVLRSDRPVRAGARVEHDGRDVGEVTSAAADGGGSVALAVLARSVVPPASVTVVDEAARVSAEVLELPS
jgi:folate-binding protein YgfZ